MKNVVISSPNTLFANGLALCLERECDFSVVQEGCLDQLKTTCIASSAEVLVAEVRHYTPYTVTNWLKTMEDIKKNLPLCKMILMVDENSHPEIAEEVKEAKGKQMIDAFFYGTVSGEYAAAVIESI